MSLRWGGSAEVAPKTRPGGGTGVGIASLGTGRASAGTPPKVRGDVHFGPVTVNNGTLTQLISMMQARRWRSHVGFCVMLVDAMGAPARKRATYEDVLRAPAHRVAEVVDGELHVQPRPGKPHAAAATALSEELGPPFKRGRGGPGGWLLLFEPELHLQEDIVVPDLAGWRRERLPELTNEEPYFTLAPDWACEVLSPSTGKLDRALKLPIYAREGVPHVWLVDPLLHLLEVLCLSEGAWKIAETHMDNAKVRAEPFAAFELDLAILWADVRLV